MQATWVKMAYSAGLRARSSARTLPCLPYTEVLEGPGDTTSDEQPQQDRNKQQFHVNGSDVSSYESTGCLKAMSLNWTPDINKPS